MAELNHCHELFRRRGHGGPERRSCRWQQRLLDGEGTEGEVGGWGAVGCAEAMGRYRGESVLKTAGPGVGGGEGTDFVSVCL